MTDTARYALYFAPATRSAWWTAGCNWLGRDAEAGADCLQPPVAGMPPDISREITAEPRRYGFHATLKAPFRLSEGFSEAHLLAMAQAFAAEQQAVRIDSIGIHTLNNFLALQTTDRGSQERINALAMRCVSYFDLLRAAPSAAELSKRLAAGLSPRQAALTARWGYPYTEEEFRFHMTLTGALTSLHEDADAIAAIGAAAGACFAEALATPLTIDGLAIFKESAPGAPMTIWQRLPFSKPAAASSAGNASGLPQAGRLFYIVGPSGVGKDSLLQWVKNQLPNDAGPVFARRSITRAAHASEAHEPMTPESFRQAAQAGHFSLRWQANDTCYGIRRGMEAELKTGRDVIVNGSREYIPQLRQLFPDARILWIAANPAMIRQRIESRSRETGAALEKRLLRTTEFTAQETDGAIHIDNSGPLEVAGHRLLEILLK
jgi:phosphonate metabolism protein PhnN/1,5-bisphosphokinase (PRPP-forming)